MTVDSKMNLLLAKAKKISDSGNISVTIYKEKNPTNKTTVTAKM